MAVAFAEVQDKVAAQGTVAIETVQWYYDNEKIEAVEAGYAGACLVCRQKFVDADPTVIVNILEGCRNSHVHQKGVTF